MTLMFSLDYVSFPNPCAVDAVLLAEGEMAADLVVPSRTVEDADFLDVMDLGAFSDRCSSICRNVWKNVNEIVWIDATPRTKPQRRN